MANHAQNLIRFCVVGGVNTLVDFGIFLLLYYKAGSPLLAAHGLAFAAAALNSYLMNKFWTFRETAPAAPAQFARFLAVVVSGLAVSSAVVYGASFFIAAWLAKVLAIGVTLIWNYTGSVLFVFRQPS